MAHVGNGELEDRGGLLKPNLQKGALAEFLLQQETI